MADLDSYFSERAIHFNKGHGEQVGLPLQEFKVITRRMNETARGLDGSQVVPEAGS